MGLGSHCEYILLLIPLRASPLGAQTNCHDESTQRTKVTHMEQAMGHMSTLVAHMQLWNAHHACQAQSRNRKS